MQHIIKHIVAITTGRFLKNPFLSLASVCAARNAFSYWPQMTTTSLLHCICLIVQWKRVKHSSHDLKHIFQGSENFSKFMKKAIFVAQSSIFSNVLRWQEVKRKHFLSALCSIFSRNNVTLVNKVWRRVSSQKVWAYPDTSRYEGTHSGPSLLSCGCTSTRSAPRK